MALNCSKFIKVDRKGLYVLFLKYVRYQKRNTRKERDFHVDTKK